MKRSHHSAVIAFLQAHDFGLPEGPTVPDLSTAERIAATVAVALEDLGEALGLALGVSIGRSLFSKPRGMVEIREKLSTLRSAVSLAGAELGVHHSHLSPNEQHIAQLYIRARRRAAQVT